MGDASGFVVSYQITPPGGSWTASDNGTYIVTLGGEPVTDLAGNMVPAGNVATFSVEVPYQSGCDEPATQGFHSRLGRDSA